MLIKRLQTGFTLVELIIVLVIIGILLAIGMPSYSNWIQNSRIRSAASAIQNGLQLARGEAVRRNAPIRFQLTSSTTDTCTLSTTDTNWVVSFDDPAAACGHAFLNEAFRVSDATNNPAPRIIQMKSSAEGSRGVVADASQSVVIFNGLGRLAAVAPATAPVEVSIDLSPSVGNCTTFRCLRVTVSIGGQIRMCDPSLPAGDPQRC